MKKKKIDLARAWRDQDYYLSLTDEQRASLGAHPAGMLALDDAALRSITGGCGSGETAKCADTSDPECTISVCPPLYCT